MHLWWSINCLLTLTPLLIFNSLSICYLVKTLLIMRLLNNLINFKY
nr:MAG TPA: hypothetical protein [Caudoviricetes sp.]